jgi:sugar porter (SP) family MFS transporter
VGALSCIFYGDKLGRLRTVFLGLILSVIALAIETSAFELAQFIIGRLLVGASIGIISASIPIWQTECATTKHRGMFVIMEGIFISAGIALPSWIYLGTIPGLNGSAQWRVTFAMPWLLFMPESPRWLARKGRLDEARNVVAAIMDRPLDDPRVAAELDHIQNQLELTTGGFRSFFKHSPERPLQRAFIALLAQSFTQWNGCSAMIFYTGSVFAQLGFSGERGKLLAAGFVTTFTAAAFVPLFLVDRIGRRVLFMVGACGMCVSMAVLAGTGGHSSLAPVALTFMFIYACSYAIGYLGLPFLYASEIAPLRLRVPVSAISVTGQWLGQFVVGQITPPGTANLGSHYWIIFAVFNASFLPLIYFFFPETNGKSLEDIDEMFESSTAFGVVRAARAMGRSGGVGVENAAVMDKDYGSSEVENVKAEKNMRA